MGFSLRMENKTAIARCFASRKATFCKTAVYRMSCLPLQSVGKHLVVE